MRLLHLLCWDMRFQARYGFYLLYGFLTALYAVVLVSLPPSWQAPAAALLIFSDPAALGLFFMGAIILLEKSQRVTASLAVSPVKAGEYVWSKVLSLSVIALGVAAVLGAAVKGQQLPQVLLGTLLSSVLFTMLGLILATKAASLNQFLLLTVPVEILTFLPAALHLFGVAPAWLSVYPASVCVDLIAGRGCSAAGLTLTAALIGMRILTGTCSPRRAGGKGTIYPAWCFRRWRRLWSRPCCCRCFIFRPCPPERFCACP